MSPHEEIRKYYAALYRTWGPQHWWPAESQFEVIIGAYLTQNTGWTNVERALENLRRVAEGTENTMPAIIEAVKAYATLGEIMDVFRAVFGEYMEPAVF